MTTPRFEFNVYKHKNKQGVLPKSFCNKCATKTSEVFYKVWEIDSFSRADDEYLGIVCKNCKKRFLDGLLTDKIEEK